MFDIKQVKAEAEKEVREEQMKRAKNALVTQMRVVATAEQVLLNERRRLADLEVAIADGNVK